MNDLSALLDAVQPTSCDFLGTTINLEVYSNSARLTHEEGREIQEVTERFRPAQERADELRKQVEKLEASQPEPVLGEGSNEDAQYEVKLEEVRDELRGIDTGYIEMARVALPFIIHSWSLNGEPMKRHGKEFPPTKENLATVPDKMLMAVGEAAFAIWQNPTPAKPSESGLAQTGSSEESQIETTTHLATSDLAPDGSIATL